MTSDPIQRSVVVLDVESSSERSNPEIGKLRSAMYRVLDEAVQRAGLAGRDIDVEDRGDGALIVVEAVPLVLLDPFAEHLIAVLQEENAAVEAVSWLRLRVALHRGPVHPDAHGWSGDTINATFAICDAPSVKATLRRADRAQLVLVVSDLLYKQIVRHGYRSINPSTYGKVQVQRIGEPAWVRAPGYPAAPVEAQQPGQAAFPVPPDNLGVNVRTIFGDNTTVNGDVVAGTRPFTARSPAIDVAEDQGSKAAEKSARVTPSPPARREADAGCGDGPASGVHGEAARDSKRVHATDADRVAQLAMFFAALRAAGAVFGRPVTIGNVFLGSTTMHSAVGRDLRGEYVRSRPSSDAPRGRARSVPAEQVEMINATFARPACVLVPRRRCPGHQRARRMTTSATARRACSRRSISRPAR